MWREDRLVGGRAKSIDAILSFGEAPLVMWGAHAYIFVCLAEGLLLFHWLYNRVTTSLTSSPPSLLSCCPCGLCNHVSEIQRFENLSVKMKPLKLFFKGKGSIIHQEIEFTRNKTIILHAKSIELTREIKIMKLEKINFEDKLEKLK